jgi:hypothetical protein
MSTSEQLLKARTLLAQVMRNYESAASIADNEGYETNYDQDKVLVDFFMSESAEK